MGKTSIVVDPKAAIERTRRWPVTEASKMEYFETDDWMDEIVSAEHFDDDSYTFKLNNGDFVTLETGGFEKVFQIKKEKK